MEQKRGPWLPLAGVLVMASGLALLLSNWPVGETQMTSRAEEVRHIASEKTVYKRSLVGTDVYRLTSGASFDSIFYQAPSFFSPNGSTFLFRAKRDDGQYRLYIIDIATGRLTKLSTATSFGWAPTWSPDGSEVLVGDAGRLRAIHRTTLRERSIRLPTRNWITFLDRNTRGDRLVFIEEERGSGSDARHIGLSSVKLDGSDYRRLYTTDFKTVFFLDHPLFVANDRIVFLTRGRNRDFTGDFNKPYLISLDGESMRLPVECSHYDVHPHGDKILCASEGYVIDLTGKKLKEFPDVRGHGAWSPDGLTFLMTGDPIPVPTGKYYGMITIMNLNTSKRYNLVSHESTYNSVLTTHIQPNAQFSPDGRFVIYESDRRKKGVSNLFLVELPRKQ